MESRVLPSRKAREDTRTRQDEEFAKKLVSKRNSPDSTGSTRGRRNAKSEERPVVNGDSKVKKTEKSKQPSTSPTENGKNTKKPAKPKANNKLKGKADRRSKSAEPMLTNGTKATAAAKSQKNQGENSKKSEPVKAKGAKKVAEPDKIDEATSENNQEQEQEDNAMAGDAEVNGGEKSNRGKSGTSKARGKKKADPPVVEDEGVPPVKKGRGGDENGEEVPAKKGRGKAVEAPEPVKKGRGKKVAKEESIEDAEEPEEEVPEQPKKGRGKKPVKDEASPAKKGKTKKQESVEEETNGESSSKAGKKLMNNVATDYKNLDFKIKEAFNFKITTWNVAGLRALIKKNPDYFKNENADVICMNEIKCSESEIPEECRMKGYHAYWNVAKSMPGVGILSKVKPIKVTNDLPNSEFSDEKRLITAEFDKFFLVSVYVVNAGRKLVTLDKRMSWNDVFDDYIKGLDAKKPVIIAGDMNVSHEEIDLAHPSKNHKSAGFTDEERDGFTKLLSYGFVDTFRHFNPDLTGAYTYWTYLGGARDRNVGWRLDYFVVSKRFMKHVKDNVIRSTVMGSDHCPTVLFLQL